MNYPIPIDTLACYKSQTRQNSDRRQCSTSGTGDVGCLAKEVLKESKKTQAMMNMLQDLYKEKDTKWIPEQQACKAQKKKATLFSKPSKTRQKRPSRAKNKHPKKKRYRKKRSWSSSSSRNSTSESSNEASNSSWETSSDSAEESTGTPSCHNSGSLYPRPAFP
ncbi:MAG: hypothetical protein [Anelloviridae sp.]|nr:MAG: hypothetical protein [Anelloviridae sp.]